MEKSDGSAMPGPGAPVITPEQIGAAIQESVGNAMQEAMAVMVTQMKAMAPRRDEGQSEALVGAVREVLAATIKIKINKI